MIGNFFQASHFQPLALFNGMHEMTGFQQRVMGTGIEPGETTTQHFYIECLPLQVSAVDVGDFQLATVGRFDALGNLDNIVVVEVQAGYRIVGFWLQRFLFNT
ncbi:hypothetical protein D3C78_1647480 [compost metagenome]